MKEIGKLAKLQKKWWYDKGECPADADGKGGGSFQSAMTLSNVAGIFYILISGLGVSMVVSLLEFLSKTCHDARKNKVKFSKMIQEKLKLPTSSEESEICEQDQPSSSHQLISQANHYFSKSSPLTASSSLRGKPATLPKRFNPQILTSPSLESTFRQAAIQQQQQQQQQQQYIQQQQQQQQRQSFYLQQLHHPPYNNNNNQQLILPQQLSSSAASPLQMKDFKNEGDFLNRQYNFHSDLDPPSITSDNFSSKCLVPAVRSSSVSLV